MLPCALSFLALQYILLKHMLECVKCTKCHLSLLALSVFTLVSDKDKNTQNIKSRDPASSFCISEGISVMTANIHDG